VLDLLSAGRVSIVAGLGYRHEEFEMFGVDRRRRGKILEEHVEVMLRAWSGESFEWEGRPVAVTPPPLTRPHPMVMIGGSTEIAARRAARLRLPLFPAIGDPELVAFYEDECAKQGFDDGFVMLPQGSSFTWVADDVDAAWEAIGPHILHEVRVYDAWQTPGQRSQVHVEATTIDEVRASGAYAVVTPEQCVALAREQGTLVFHPLIGGVDPALAWEMLRLLDAEVLPELTR
jgi:alkanesulfonate monooxygenase SsuD/methylene tetrahydromethanopterin reductase-like flavin-dependent oxidoreductase (luciferase family)